MVKQRSKRDVITRNKLQMVTQNVPTEGKESTRENVAEVEEMQLKKPPHMLCMPLGPAAALDNENGKMLVLPASSDGAGRKQL